MTYEAKARNGPEPGHGHGRRHGRGCGPGNVSNFELQTNKNVQIFSDKKRERAERIGKGKRQGKVEMES